MCRSRGLTDTSSNDKTQSCSFNLTGISAGMEPRRVAEMLRTSLQTNFSENHANVTSAFQSLEDGSEFVTVDSRSVPVANFAIKLDMTQQPDPQVAELKPRRKK